ncbi:MAG: 16S rRNA (guanine(966)-N(2))-methyltransferase RsmD [Bacteroidia bacterium]|nr:16S rRNA (guanine(966)-N(2))-methyltransferase RsmD [Bacteroidia bacterium]
MRIISGTHKGKPLYPPKNFDARPTTDFAKESLFNILNNHFDLSEISVLDLFSGTGSISFEFASRGCNDVTAVEINFRHYSFIKKAAAEMKFDTIKVVKNNVFTFMKYCKKNYDLIFADPPYDMKNIDSIPGLIFEKKLLKESGRLIVEHSQNTDFSKHPGFIDLRTYGSVNFSFFAIDNSFTEI